ncbi:MAG: MBL fold metallo-hydrolase [bacterium]|nr:MBL fold metallo-hydrolase [bacterium]
MIITYHGEGCFKIQSGNLSMVIDPLNDRMKPDVVLKTAVPFPGRTPDPRIITGPGEYEIEGIEIRGVQLLNESSPKLIKTVYIVTFEEIKLGFLGEAFNMPDVETLEALGEAEIIFLPVGGKPYLSPEEAVKIVKQIEPSIVIPSFYKSPKDFFEEMGQKPDPQEKLVIKKKEVVELGDSTKVVCLKI